MIDNIHKLLDGDFKISNNKIIIGNKRINLYSKEGFRFVSELWLKIGWNEKYTYTFSWLGRPIIQNPEDMIRIQEIIYKLKPDYIIETGIAHGGSIIYYASILNSIGKGRVIGIDIEIRKKNLIALQKHKLFNKINLLEGSSTSKNIIKKVKELIGNSKKIIVILDSSHTYKHVSKELNVYSKFVSKNSYIVVTDGYQEYLKNVPRAKADYKEYSKTWKKNNPKKAAEQFTNINSNFKIVEPKFPFNESKINFRVTHWPSAFLKKIK